MRAFYLGNGRRFGFGLCWTRPINGLSFVRGWHGNHIITVRVWRISAQLKYGA